MGLQVQRTCLGIINLTWPTQGFISGWLKKAVVERSDKEWETKKIILILCMSTWWPLFWVNHNNIYVWAISVRAYEWSGLHTLSRQRVWLSLTFCLFQPTIRYLDKLQFNVFFSVFLLLSVFNPKSCLCPFFSPNISQIKLIQPVPCVLFMYSHYFDFILHICIKYFE